MDYIKEFADVVVNLIVISFRVKRRVDVTKVKGFVANEFSQNVEIVAVVELVHRCRKREMSLMHEKNNIKLIGLARKIFYIYGFRR